MSKKIDKRTKEYKEFIKKNPQGLGDRIANFTSKIGLDKLVDDDCGCDERREKLNDLFPTRFKARRCFNDDELQWYDNYYKTRTLNLVTADELKKLVIMHEQIFNWKVNGLCHNCSGSAKIIKSMIDRLDKMYLSYNKNL